MQKNEDNIYSNTTTPMDYLASIHTHSRDQFISFIEETHVYNITDPDDTFIDNYTSVTTFIHSLFPKFDAPLVIQKMMKSPTWKTSKYFGMTAEQITQEWEDKKNVSAQSGTLMHKSIEEFYNGNLTGIDTIEYTYFLEFHKNIILPSGLRPYRTEWCVYDIDTKIAGSIDMVYQLYDGDDVNLAIYDWKRVENMRFSNTFSSAKPPFEHIPDCNFYHYSIQLNIYRYILEKNYGKKIHELRLVILHPSNMNFETVEVPIMDDLVEQLLAYRKSLLTCSFSEKN